MNERAALLGYADEVLDGAIALGPRTADRGATGTPGAGGLGQRNECIVVVNRRR